MTAIVSTAVNDVNVIARKSWVAYITPVSLDLLMMVFSAFLIMKGHLIPALAVIFVIVPVLTYRILLLKSFKLFVDDHGVWAESSVFPWAIHMIGMRWGDIDHAYSKVTLITWLTRASGFALFHRHSVSKGIVLSDLHNAEFAIRTINQRVNDQRKHESR